MVYFSPILIFLFNFIGSKLLLLKKEKKTWTRTRRKHTVTRKMTVNMRERVSEKSDQVNLEEENQPKPESELTEEQKEIREALHLEQECDLMKKRRANMDVHG